MLLGVQGRIKDIGDKLKEADPLLPTHLASIHSTLIQYEELVHLLSDEEIKTFVAGQIKHVGVKLVEEITKPTKARVSSRIPKTSVDDL
jgi:hypothetical protein